MAFLENRHVNLDKVVDLKIAVDAEFNDSVLNRSEEDWFVVTGLPRLGQMSCHDFQGAVRKQITDIIRVVLHSNNRARLDFEVMQVSNPIPYKTSGPTLYNVRMDSKFSAGRIRDLFSSFIRHDRPLPRPPPLKGVSIRNKITLDTKIRIAILRQLGAIWQSANPGSSFQVKGYLPRPVLTTNPARSTNARPRTYNFIQAVTTLNAQFSDENLTMIYQTVGDHHPGKLRSLFIILNDDQRDYCLNLVKASRDQRDQRSGNRPQPTSQSTQPSQVSHSASAFGQISGPGDGMSLESGFLESLRHPPVPPPPKETRFDLDPVRDHNRGRSRSRSRSHERTDRDTRTDRDRGIDHKRGRSRSRSRSRSRQRSNKTTVKNKSKRNRSRSRSRSGSRTQKGVKRRHRSSSSSVEASKSRSKKKKKTTQRRDKPKSRSKKAHKKRSRQESSSSSSSSSSSDSASSRSTRSTQSPTADKGSRPGSPALAQTEEDPTTRERER